MKLCLVFILALVASAFAQEAQIAAVPSIDLLDADEIDDDEEVSFFAASDEENTFDDFEASSVDGVKKRADEPQVDIDEELVIEAENLEDEEDKEDREKELIEDDDDTTVKRQVGLLAAGRNNNNNNRNNVRNSVISAWRDQLAKNQRSRRELSQKQHQDVQALRQQFRTVRQTLLQQQVALRRLTLQQHRNETLLLQQTQRIQREQLLQQQRASLLATPEAQRPALRLQFRQQRETLRQTQRQQRETLQQTHAQQRQSLRLKLRQDRESLRLQQQRDRQTLRARQVEDRRQLRQTILAQNQALRAQLRQEAEKRVLNRASIRLTAMTRALSILNNVTAITSQTSSLLTSFQGILGQLRTSVAAGNVTLYRTTLRSVTINMLRLLRNMSRSQDLATSAARSALRSLVSQSRALRGISPFHVLPFGGSRQSPSHGTRVGLGTRFVPRLPSGSRGNSTRSAFGQRGNSDSRRPSTGTRGNTVRPIRPNFSGFRGTNANNRGQAYANLNGAAGANGFNLIAQNGNANANGNNGLVTAVGDDGTQLDNSASSASSNAGTPGWAVAVVVLASVVTIALVIVAGLLAVRMARDQN